MKTISAFCSAIKISASLLALTACAQSSEILKLPAIVPISLGTSGNILTKTVSVKEFNYYYFSLRFSFNEHDTSAHNRIFKLMGGKEAPIGAEEAPMDKGSSQSAVPTPVWLGVYLIDAGQEIEVFTKETDPVLTSWGGDYYLKVIAAEHLKPGKYIVRLKSLRSTHEFDDIATEFEIGFFRWGK